MPTKINVIILADSICNGHRITTMKLTYPRFIHSEMCRHRMFSRNTASSRAIPFQKMMEAVKNDPVIPIAWQKSHSGMQGTEYITSGIGDLEDNWLRARDAAYERALEAAERGTTKQIINRLLEPWMWTVEIVTATEWENFFHLRCPKYVFEIDDCKDVTVRSRKDMYKQFPKQKEVLDGLSDLDWLHRNIGQAEIHMMALAEAMWDARNESEPKELQPGDWHLPYENKIRGPQLSEFFEKLFPGAMAIDLPLMYEIMVSISTAMLAQTSYTVVGEDGKPASYENLIDLHNSLLIRPYTNRKGVIFGPDDPIHASPAEHCNQAMMEYESSEYVKTVWVDNLEEYTSSVPRDSFMIAGRQGKGATVREYGWSQNFRGWKSYRSMIPNENRR